jgi:branched-chain amino acid transport system substrate-binding protein
MNGKRLVSLAAVAGGLALAAVVFANISPAAPARVAATPCSGSVGVMGSFTGDRASIGQEELHWARFAISQFNAQNGTSFKAVEGDFADNPAQASTIAQQFLSDKSILAVAGPDASSAVVVVGGQFKKAQMGFISGSATRVSLTNGDYPTFFRVVPNDNVQGPTDANFMINRLHVKKVMLVDNQTDYSSGLNASVAKVLKAAGVTVVPAQTTTTQTDFSALVATIGDDVSAVFLPLEVPADAQLLAQQLAAQGKHTVVFGSDSVFSPKDFHPNGAYVSAFAPDITALPADAKLVAAYKAQYGSFSTPFGPPVYTAMNVILRAMKSACAHGTPTRAMVLAEIRKTNIARTILGSPLSFKKNGEPSSTTFYVYKVENGAYKLLR